MPLVSRVLVTLVGLPLVLLVVWAGGWWLFALAGVAAVLALHEYALMIRSLRPVILAAYAGALLSLLGAHVGELPLVGRGGVEGAQDGRPDSREGQPEAADLDEAVAWAKKAAIACDVPGEVRELLFYPAPEQEGGGSK